jgi:surfactin synthase thioesterase subunit
MTPRIFLRSEWLRGYDERPAAGVRLVCFPHAGGSTAFYRSWHRGLSPRIELYAVQYPGRGDRRLSPPIDDVRTMARLVVDDLGPLLDRPVALFGHSMGAFIAYEAARLLEERHVPPAHLFASGQIAPRYPTSTPNGTVARPAVAGLADADDESLMRHLDRLGGTEVELLADPALREIFLPYIRNDFRLVESYSPAAGPPLTAPITALAGTDDPVATPTSAEHWRELTSSNFALEVFTGGHFFLLPEQAGVLEVINKSLTMPDQAVSDGSC